MGRHDPERDGSVHEDTAKGLDPRAFVIPPDEDDAGENADDDG
jgi:hypothetical protein